MDCIDSGTLKLLAVRELCFAVEVERLTGRLKKRDVHANSVKSKQSCM